MRRPARFIWALLVVLLLAAGLTRLHFDTEVLNLLPGDVPVVKGLKLYQDHFASSRELIILIKHADPQVAENAASSIGQHLGQQSNLVASSIWQPPWLEHPEQSGELIAYLWFNGSPADLRQLATNLEPARLPALLSTQRERLATSMSPNEIARGSYDPFGLTQLPNAAAASGAGFGGGSDFFSSSDGTSRLIFVQATRDLLTYRDCDEWLAQIKAVVARSIPSGATPEILYTGRPAFVAEIASGMQRDITISIAGTSLIIAALFYIAHRRWKPMFWLLALLALVLGGTLALGGLVFGRINVVSMGFAAILLGLAVDYALVHYQEALAHPDLSIPQIRRAIAPSIFWAATTTIAAFVVLNFGGLPGLAQLGSLVAMGVALSACVMIFAFLPPLFPDRLKPRSTALSSMVSARGGLQISSRTRLLRWAASAVVLLACVLTVFRGLPAMDPTANALRPRHSPAYSAAEQLKQILGQRQEPLWLITSGASEGEVAAQLDQLQPKLSQGVSNGVLSGFNLPVALWPHPQLQEANHDSVRDLVHRRQTFHDIASAHGFAPSSLGLLDQVLNSWDGFAHQPGVVWPTNDLARWILGKFTAKSATGFYALGILTPAPHSSSFSAFAETLPREHTVLSGWELLGAAIFNRVRSHVPFLVLPMVALVLLSLWFAFRRWTEICLSLAVLGLSILCLLATMHWLGWQWNLLNLMALPLVLGTGVDYSIFMQLALRRHHGDMQLTYRSVGRALLLCGATAISGFGSLALSSNAGMSSLGLVCATGIAFNMLISIFLLPYWWQSLVRPGSSPAIEPRPSSFYRKEFWLLGLWCVRIVPAWLAALLLRLITFVYWIAAVRRREIVIHNLEPVFSGNHALAVQAARRLFRNFSTKLYDLFRMEAGLPIDDLFDRSTGWEEYLRAQKEGRGVLLLSAHLGNWEFGAPWMARQGVPLTIITLAEPGGDFTQLRQSSRSRWNVETLVIGDDGFGFIEIIRRLENGGTVALLMDRPPPSTEIRVRLFDRDFHASRAAAELARASGCVLLPVYLPYSESGYDAHVLPRINYDRAALRDPSARQDLTQRIMDALAGPIHNFADQWYHFVPVWPLAPANPPSNENK